MKAQSESIKQANEKASEQTKKKHFRLNKTTLFFLFPSLVLYTVFLIYPSLNSIYMSFTNWDGISPTMTFIGLDNYITMFQSERFYNALKNTFILTIVLTILENVVALAMALMVDKIFFAKNFFRSVFYIPQLLSGIVAGFIWMIMYNYNFGIINGILDSLNLANWKQDWLGNPDLAIYALVFTIVWQRAGFFMVIYLAALQGIPKELTEASQIDGATPLQRFMKVTFPLLAGAVTVNMTLSMINNMKIFDQIAVMTNGGPGFATETLTYIIYKVAFAELQQGYGTALSIILFVFILLFSLAQVYILRKREVQM